MPAAEDIFIIFLLHNSCPFKCLSVADYHACTFHTFTHRQYVAWKGSFPVPWILEFSEIVIHVFCFFFPFNKAKWPEGNNLHICLQSMHFWEFVDPTQKYNDHTFVFPCMTFLRSMITNSLVMHFMLLYFFHLPVAAFNVWMHVRVYFISQY